MAKTPDQTQDQPDLSLPTAKTHTDTVKSMGDWAWDNRDTFNSTAGNLAFRNFARTLVAIVPYVAVNVAVQHFFKHTVGAGKSFGKWLTPIAKNPIAQSTAAIAASFTTFRSTCKVWQENYDRIFKAKSKEEATDAIAHLPGNIINDYVRILPSELAATGTTAIVLGGIRGSIKKHEPAGSQKASYALDAKTRAEFPGGWKQLKGGFANDYLANAAGYAAFFEATDRLYSVISKKHKNGVYDKGTLPIKDPDQPATPYDRLTGDTTGRLLFRNVAGVFAAALPFIAVQRFANSKTGNYNPPKNSYLKDVGVGLVSWEPSFAIFTSGIEAWQRGYDKLFDQLQEKYSAESKESAKTRI